MKQIFFLLAMSFTNLLYAQAPFLNGDFEDWRSSVNATEMPANAYWLNTDSAYGTVNGYPRAIYKTSDAYHGNYALQLVSKDSAGLRTYGDIYTGNCCNNGQPIPAIPYNDRPKFMFFYYKYITDNPDTASIFIQFAKAGDTAIGGNFLYMYPVAQYTKMIVPIFFGDIATPQKLLVRFSSTITTQVGKGNSVLYVDSIAFTNDTSTSSSTIPLHLLEQQITVYTTPDGSQIILHAPENVFFNLYSITGQLLLHKEINGTASIDITQLPSALYVYTIQNDKRRIIKKDKISK